MEIFIPINEKEEKKKIEELHKIWRQSLKREFSYLLEELEDDFLEDPCADNYERYLDVKEFLEDYDDLDVKTICWMRDEYRLYARKYNLRFY